MTLTDRWLALGDRLYDKGKAIFDHSDVPESEAGTKDPKVVALTLLARTMGNFADAVLLLNDHHVVEARRIARCCYENLFWIAALSKKSDEFIRSMELDDAASRMKRATGLLDWTKQQAQCFDFAESLGKFRDDMKERHGKPGGISQWDAADAGGVGPAYIIYRELSGELGTSVGHVAQPARDLERRGQGRQFHRSRGAGPRAIGRSGHARTGLQSAARHLRGGELDTWRRGRGRVS